MRNSQFCFCAKLFLNVLYFGEIAIAYWNSVIEQELSIKEFFQDPSKIQFPWWYEEFDVS